MDKLWFKRKSYGWGWYPATKEGWFVTFGYVVLVIAFASTLNDNSPANEVWFMGIIPVFLLTIALIKICYARGEKPRWQWGSKNKEE